MNIYIQYIYSPLNHSKGTQPFKCMYIYSYILYIYVHMYVYIFRYIHMNIYIQYIYSPLNHSNFFLRLILRVNLTSLRSRLLPK